MNCIPCKTLLFVLASVLELTEPVPVDMLDLLSYRPFR